MMVPELPEDRPQSFWRRFSQAAWELKRLFGELEAFADIADSLDVAAAGRYDDRVIAYVRPGGDFGTTTYYLVISRDLTNNMVMVPIEEDEPVSKARLRSLWDYHGPHRIVELLEEGEHRD